MHPTLHKGSRGVPVRILQCHLRRFGHGVTVDGDFGAQTSTAVRKFQRAHNLKTDVHFTVGHGTWHQLLTAKARSNHPIAYRALAHAFALVGVMEEGGNNIGPVVSRLIRAAGGTPGEPWCGDFVIYNYRVAGSKKITRSAAAVRLLGPLAGMHRLKKPFPSCVIKYAFDHEGLFVRDLGGGMIETVEGNTGATGATSDSLHGGDGVYIKHRPLSQVAAFYGVNG
jgi:hypothetical protein